MDVIKMEPEVDPLDLQSQDNTWQIDENDVLSEEGTSLELQANGTKIECMDHSYDLTSQIKVEDTPVPFSFAVVKCEVQDSSVPISCPMVKSEVDHCGLCSED
ncbi:uncharacterized protein [Periplaneta americana]|uniref:uncharacterized protein isoform X2 n=1 Tax=Periplaneta americana TaxID=6978 RepID=UPI0037E9C95B